MLCSGTASRTHTHPWNPDPTWNSVTLHVCSVLCVPSTHTGYIFRAERKQGQRLESPGWRGRAVIKKKSDMIVCRYYRLIFSDRWLPGGLKNRRIRWADWTTPRWSVQSTIKLSHSETVSFTLLSVSGILGQLCLRSCKFYLFIFFNSRFKEIWDLVSDNYILSLKSAFATETYRKQSIGLCQ